jgi:excisionase family DNA binding protein
MNVMKQAEGIQEVFTLAEVASLLRIGRVTAWRLVKRGDLKAFRAGKGWRVLRNDLIKFVEGEGGRGKRRGRGSPRIVRG